MTWDRVKKTGTGRLNFRLVFDGFPIEAVTSEAMEKGPFTNHARNANNGGAPIYRRVGLISDEIKIEERCDLITAKPSHSGFTARIADVGKVWSKAFFRQPTAVTYLVEQIDNTDTELVVMSEEGFEIPGTVWIDKEAVYIGGSAPITLAVAIERTLEAGNLFPLTSWRGSGGTAAVVTSGQPDPAGGTDAYAVEDDSTGAARSEVDLVPAPYTSGHSLCVSFFVKKNETATHFPDFRLEYTSGGTHRLELRLDTGQHAVNVGTWEDIAVIDFGGWWFVRLLHAGEVGPTSVRLAMYPALGDVSSFPGQTLAKTGSTTVYGARIADATADPIGADILRAAGASRFTGAVRAQLGTLDVHHYVQAYATEVAGSVRYPEVTDWPRGIADQRARLYAYGDGDDLQGDGTPIWTGRVGGEPRYDGTAFSIPIDPLWKVLETELGSDLADPCTIDGVYYPAAAFLSFSVDEYDHFGVNPGSPESGGGTASTVLAFAGRFETNAEFCAALQTLLRTAIANPTSGTFHIHPDELSVVEHEGRWAIVYSPSTSTTPSGPYWLRFRGQARLRFRDAEEPVPGLISAVDGVFWERWTDVDTGQWLQYDDHSVEFSSFGSFGSLALQNGRSYRYDIHDHAEAGIEGAGTVPRAILLPEGDPFVATSVPTTNRLNINSSAPRNRIYVTGQPTETVAALAAEWEPVGPLVVEGQEDTFVADVAAVDTVDRWLEVRPAQRWSATSASLPELRMGRSLSTGTLRTMIEALASATREGVNLGITPEIRPAIMATNPPTPGDFDLDDFADLIAELTAALPWTRGRKYTYFDSVQLTALIEHECRALAVFPALTSSGALTFRPLRGVAESEIPVITIDADKAITDESWYSLSKSAYGTVNSIVVKTGYDPVEGEHRGRTYRGRDVRAFGFNPRATVLEIAPLSVDPPDPSAAMSVTRATEMAARITGVFGLPYQVLQLEVPLTLIGTLLGDVVRVSWKKLPDDDGKANGPTPVDRIGWVLYRKFVPRQARGELSLYLPHRAHGGYAPEARVAIAGSGADKRAITVAAGYLPDGATTADFWAVGDRVRFYKWGSTDTTSQLGIVVSPAPSSLSLTVQPVAADGTEQSWAHDGSTWVLAPRQSTDIGRSIAVQPLASQENQRRFAYIARVDGRIHWAAEALGPNPEPAQVLAP